MTTQITGFITVILILTALFYVYFLYKRYKNTDRKEKHKVLRVYLVVFLVSVLIFGGIRMVNISERMGWILDKPAMEEIFEYHTEGGGTLN